MRVCGPRCQRILWPAHRTLCGRDPTFFYLPGLTPVEADWLERVKDEPFSLSRKTFVEYVTALTPGLTWKDLVAIVSSDTTSSTLADAMRNTLLVHAFFHLDLMLRNSVGPSPLWHSFATLAVPTFVHCSRHLGSQLGADLWRVTNDVLRQVLVYAALPGAVADPALEMGLDECVRLEILAQARVVEAVARAQVAQAAKDVLVANSVAHLEVLKDKLAALRPTHEPLCGRDPDVFYLAPLSPADLEQLERTKGDTFPVTGDSFEHYIEKLFKVRPWPTFISLVTSTEPTSPSHATARNNLLAYSYLHLGAPILAQPGLPALPPWHLFGCLAADWIQRCTRPRPDTGVPDCPSRDANRVLNGLLRQELVRATIESAARGPDPAIDEFEARLWEVVACGRTLKELERAELGDEARTRLVKEFKEGVLDPRANALLERTMQDAQVQPI
ncbi:hypothetical protein JCM3775_006012 [Rhodotorula graminis]